MQGDGPGPALRAPGRRRAAPKPQALRLAAARATGNPLIAATDSGSDSGSESDQAHWHWRQPEQRLARPAAWRPANLNSSPITVNSTRKLAAIVTPCRSHGAAEPPT